MSGMSDLGNKDIRSFALFVLIIVLKSYCWVSPNLHALFVLFMFLVLIKPIREFSTFFMLQFNSLDRVEDRPNTLKWIVLGNMLPGLIIITVFKQLFETYLNLPLLASVVVLTVAIGDGLQNLSVHIWVRKNMLYRLGI